MKLRDNIKPQLTPFEAAGATWYMKALTVKDVQKLQEQFKSMEQSGDISALMVLFTDVLVDENGEVFEDVANGMTFEELSEMVPIMILQELAEKVTQLLAGESEGN